MMMPLFVLLLMSWTAVRGQYVMSQRQLHLHVIRERIETFLRPNTAPPEDELVLELKRLPRSRLLKLPVRSAEEDIPSQKVVIIYGTVGRLMNADDAEHLVSQPVVSFKMPSQEYQWYDASVWLPTQQPSPWIGIRTESSETMLFDRVRTVRRQGWLTARITSFLLESRKGDTVQIMLENTSYENPFLTSYIPPFLHLVGTEVNDMEDFERVRRKRDTQGTTTDCNGPANASSCCRDRIRVSFEELGWAEKVLEPKHVDLYFCRGSCDTFGPWESLGALDYSVPMRTFQRVLNLRPCCVAKRSSPLQLTLATENSSVFIRRFIPDLVIEECACLGTQYIQN